MTEAVASRSWTIPIVGLFLATFAINTSEYIVAGLLPSIATDLKVDIPTAGLLITGYALGVAIAGPILALLTGRLPRRTLVFTVIVVFIVGNLLCALAGSYWLLLAARLLIACCHGLYFGVAMVLGNRVAPEGRQASAVSLVIAAITLANVLGVPIGAAIGAAYGWRMAFLAIAAMGVVAIAVLFVLIPRTPEPEHSRDNFGAEIAAALRPVVLLCYATVALCMVGVFTVFSYVVPLIMQLGGVPEGLVPWVLFVMGLLGFAGNLAGGRLGDWKPNATMLGVLAISIVLALVMAALVASPWAFVASILLFWLIIYGFPAPIQTRILRETRDFPNFASTLIPAAFNLGIAGGAGTGGAAIAIWGYGSLPLISAAFLALTLCGTLVLAAYDRRVAAVRAPAAG